MNEGEPAPYTGVLVPIAVWDHYQEIDLKHKFIEERLSEAKKDETFDLSGLFFIAGVALGVASISAVNSQYHIPLAFAGGTVVGASLVYIIE